MKPLIYSVKEATRGRPFWVRSGSAICYFRNYYRKQTSTQSSVQSAACTPADVSQFSNPGQNYFTLSFCLKFKHRNDVVYIAYHYPYSYTTLLVFLYSLRELFREHRSNIFYFKEFWKIISQFQRLKSFPSRINQFYFFLSSI